MFSQEWIEEFDARRGIPRKANEQYLPAYQAFWAWANDVGQAAFFISLGLVGAFLSLFAGYLLEARGLLWLVFWSLAILALAAAFLDAYLLAWSYRLWTMSTSHGSARWARLKDLTVKRLVNRLPGMPLPKDALPLAKIFGGRDLYLPKNQWLRHFVMFGPTGSGKSKTFFMAMIRACLKRASCLVYDPKGELCEQTGSFARRVFRLDLNNPEKSDRWNFVPLCRENPALACQIAGMMIGAESRQKTSQDPFWGDAEQLALTAILLHLAAVYGERAIPAFAADFLIATRDGDAFGAAMKTSPSFYAQQAYFAFCKAPVQTRGSVLIGLYNKLRPFTLAPARSVTACPTREEIEKGCRQVDFRELRKPGTAIFLVVSEGAADMYKEFIATFLGQAVLEMRLDGMNDPKYPCFVLIDEAYQLNVAEVKRISGIGRGRGVGLGLGYQDLPQMYDQYGKEQANAILGTVMTKIFLPGLDDVTAEYASKQLGDTTIFAKTYQDFPGKRNDNIRYAEQKRALMHAGEVRQIAPHKELLVVCDTAPPIKAAYPPLAMLKSKFSSREYGKPYAPFLGDIDSRYSLEQIPASSNTTDSTFVAAEAETVTGQSVQLETATMGQIIDETISEVIDESKIIDDETIETKPDFETPIADGEDIGSRIAVSSITRPSASINSKLATVLTRTIEADSHKKKKAKSNKSGANSEANSDILNGLPAEVRAVTQEIYDSSLLKINRSVF
jgi:type IV secretion system protein VirD4